jgi:C1A family cysteine protease
MRFILSILAFVTIGALALSNEEYQYQFGNFQVAYGKDYASMEEYTYRFGVFKSNLDRISAHNALNKSWTLAVNPFADMTWDEFKATRLQKNVRSNDRFSIDAEEAPQLVNIPETVDWRTKGVVNKVKDQGSCGSCWAFSAVGAVESACALKTGKLLSLSEQEVVDCSKNGGNDGCNGGDMPPAFAWEKANGGLCLEKDYAYKGKDGTCKKSCTKHCAISGYVNVKAGDETALKQAVAITPVAVSVEADQDGFQFYSSGIFDGKCGTDLDHGVVAVGYGTENGKMYWLVRNSWGASWGDAGYIKLIRHDGKGNGQCGIALVNSYPLM